MKKILLVLLLLFLSACAQTADQAVYPSHDPIGKARGIYPGRVVWGYDPDTVDWDGEGYWWNLTNFNEEKISDLLSKSLEELTGKEDEKSAWDSLFTYTNENRGETGSYTPGQKLAIKVNLNGSQGDENSQTNLSYVNPVLLRELLKSLTTSGVRAEDITVFDITRVFPKYLTDYCHEGGLEAVNFVDNRNAVIDQNKPINWSVEIDGEKSYLPTCLTQADYLINLANLKGHSYGITLSAKNLFGVIMNSEKSFTPQQAGLHPYLNNAQMDSYSPLTDLLADEEIFSKTTVYMLDALIAAPSEGKELSLENTKWRQDPFNGDFTSSIFLSQDPVALDSAGADFLTNEEMIKEVQPVVGENKASENYLHESALISNPPSGTNYNNPLGLESLGVHEHWNDVNGKKYSGSENGGIELIRVDT